MTVEFADIIKIFEWGIDYGLLIAEEERDNEDIFDAFLCGVSGRKYGVPSVPARRRQSHSDRWRQAKKDGLLSFIGFIAEKGGQ